MYNLINSVKFSSDKKRINEHFHDSHQIIYVAKGNVEITVDKTKYNVSSGMMFFISRLETHSIKIVSNVYERYELQISPDFVNNTSSGYKLYSIIMNRSINFNRILSMPQPVMTDIFDKLIAEFNNSLPYKEHVISNVLDLLFINIYRSYPNMFFDVSNPIQEIVRKIQLELEDNISSVFSLDSLAFEHNINKYYLSHIFKSVTGYSIMKYLKYLRITKAKSLLINSTYNISKIVICCGYSDTSNFSRDFKEVVFLTPTQFRKRHSGR